MAPTEQTAFYHGLRVHLQIITCKVLDNTEIELMPDEWGWYWKGNQLFPIMTDLDVAPESLLRWYNAIVNRHHKISVEQIYAAAAVSMGWNVSTCGECFEENSENKEVT